jgi:hypothetical protein
VVAAANKAGIDDLIQADDVEDGCLCYTSDAHGLMLWAVDGVVASVTLFPRYDETGDVPCWPA